MSQYKVEFNRKNELRGFCRQYPGFKEQLEHGIKRKGYGFIPMRLKGAKISNPVEHEAVMRDKLFRKCLLIERAAVEADPKFFDEIIKITCYGVRFEKKWYEESGIKDTIEYFYYILDYLKD